MKVSVVVPTYNRPQLLTRFLRSLRKQTYRNYEVIIIDDASLNSREYFSLVNKYKKYFKTLRYYRNENNMGAPFSRNKGILSAKGKLIAFADDDDEWLPEKLEKQVGIFKNKWNVVDIVYVWTTIKDTKGNLLQDYSDGPQAEGCALQEILKSRNAIPPTSTVMIKKGCLLEIGLFNTRLPSSQDYDLYIRLFKHGYKCIPIKEVLCRNHEQYDSISRSHNAYKGHLMIAYLHFGLFMKYSPFSIIKLLISAARTRIRLKVRERIRALLHSFDITVNQKGNR